MAKRYNKKMEVPRGEGRSTFKKGSYVKFIGSGSGNTHNRNNIGKIFHRKGTTAWVTPLFGAHWMAEVENLKQLSKEEYLLLKFKYGSYEP